MPGSAETLRALLEAGKRIVFVTNNPGKLPAAYAERLGELGVEVGEEQIVTAGIVVARLAGEAAGEGGGAFVIGAAPLKEMVAATGARLLEGEEAWEADAVVVSGHRGFDYEELVTAKRALERGAALFATSHDPTMPYPGGELPGTGAVLAAVETASGRRAEIAGKPERHLFEMALEALGRVRRSVAMIGDRISSDIDGGRARGAGDDPRPQRHHVARGGRGGGPGARLRARGPQRPAGVSAATRPARGPTTGRASTSPGSSPSPSAAWSGSARCCRSCRATSTARSAPATSRSGS